VNSVIETDKIGKNVEIGPFCYIGKNVVIEDGCKLRGYVSIGRPAEYINPPEYKEGEIIISFGTEIREFVSITLPTSHGLTYVGSECLIMANSHISHDCSIGRNTSIAIGTSLAGYVKIGNYCSTGLNSTIHQFSTLGSYCILGASSFFKGESPDGLKWVGCPARPIGINKVGLDRALITSQGRRTIEINAMEFYNKWETIK